jgi:hypothetical protein
LAKDEYVLSEGDRIAIASALNEVLHGPGAIKEWEFHPRLGVSRASALQTLRRMARD